MPESHERTEDEVETNTTTLGESTATLQSCKETPAICAKEMKSELKEFDLVSRCYKERAMADAQGDGDGHKQINTIALVVVTTVAFIYLLTRLLNMLVPFVLAVFLMTLMEPLLFFFLSPVQVCKRFCHCTGFTPAQEKSSRGFSADRGRFQHNLGRVCWYTWSFIAVFLCVLAMVAVFCGCLLVIAVSVLNFRWEKYAQSPRLKQLMDSITSGADGQSDSSGEVMDAFVQGPLLYLVGTIASTFTTLFLMLMFFIFLLFSNIENAEKPPEHTLGHKAKLATKKFFRIKTQMCLAIGCLIWLVFEMYDVDLAFLFGFLAFSLSYLPHIGFAFFVLVPLPLVILDPTKSLSDIVFVLSWPTLIHQIVANVIEPKLLASSLDLHPITVLFSIMFWSSCWGNAGAVLAVPLTCSLRLLLFEADHPYATVIIGLLEGQWGPTTQRKMALGPVQQCRGPKVTERIVGWIGMWKQDFTEDSVHTSFEPRESPL